MKKGWLIWIVFVVTILSASLSWAAPKYFFATSTTGGTQYALDNIATAKIDDGAMAVVVTSAQDGMLYVADGDSGATESDPDVIQPDDEAGDKRWVLVDIVAASFYVAGTQISSDDLSDTNSIAMLDEAETITGNWVNTANPWADNEVSDTITVGASGSVNADALPSSGTWDASGLDLTLPNTAYDPTPASDDSWQGAIMTVTAGESIDQWDIVYLKYDTDGPRAYSYHADSTDGDNDTYLPFGIAIEAGTAGNTFDIGIGFGVARNDGWSFTDATDEGKPVYCSEAAAGGIELAEPADTGDHVIRIGNLIDEDEVMFNFGGFYDYVVP